MLLSVYVEEAHVVIEQNNSHNENMQNRSVRKTSRALYPCVLIDEL